MTGTTTNPPPWATREGFRANNFDVMRFALASAVIFSHAYPITLGGETYANGKVEWDAYEPVFQLTGHQASLGDFAVNGFFLLSGFLIAHSFLHSSSLIGYLWKRVLRIYPAFLVATLLTALVAWHTGAFSPFAADHVGDAALLNSYRAVGDLTTNPLPDEANGSLWTIRYEFGCYLAVAAVGLVGALRSRWIALGLAVLFTLSAFGLELTGKTLGWTTFGVPEGPAGQLAYFTGSPHFWPRLLSFFFAGVAFHRWRDALPHNNLLGGLSAGGFVAALLLPHGVALLAPAALTYLLFWIAYHPKIKLQGFGRHGDFSYGIYLYAFPIQQLLVWHGLTGGPWTNALLTLPLAVLAGAASWHGVEKWFMKLKPGSNRPKVSRPEGVPDAPAQTPDVNADVKRRASLAA